ncbi:MAG: glycosyltransferase family 2 protein [Myxococcales bacterium]|nr:MAG: glycosyltransferase family 2 protein [Myxococcales bacterium]
MSEPPEVSFVIPVFNEEAILRAAVVDLRERLAPHGLRYELILAENGSRDGTVEVARELVAHYPEVRLERSDEPNYGRALREGILASRGVYVICEEIDLCDVDFHLRALALLRTRGADFVVGSKLIGGARDERPWLRHAASQLYTGVLRLLFDFQGTDTHGLKAFRRESVAPLVAACRIERDVFASELTLRAHRAPLRVVELPVRVLEKRPPSINLTRRVPRVLANLAQLAWAIRFDRSLTTTRSANHEAEPPGAGGDPG